ncbi:MAG: hypothetical protein ACRD0G_13845 [Acidimicrobiales bacterium]
MDLASLALLACPVGMGVMMWWMSRGNRHGNVEGGKQVAASGTEQEILALRAEMEALREQNQRAPQPQVRRSVSRRGRRSN